MSEIIKNIGEELLEVLGDAAKGALEAVGTGNFNPTAIGIAAGVSAAAGIAEDIAEKKKVKKKPSKKKAKK